VRLASRSSCTWRYWSFERVSSRKAPKASMDIMAFSLRSAMSSSLASSSGFGARSL
jgi:hypothetical protein